jgi:hypothetical protein
MQIIARRRALIAPILGIALSSLALAAEGPATPEPTVVASIEQPAKQGGACLITAEIRDPKSNEVLAAPKLAVAAGEQAKVSSSEAARKVDVTITAGPDCAGGTYVVNVWISGKLAYSKSGALKPKA